MVTYEEFKERILKKAEEEIEGRATINTVRKNNGVKLDALVIMTMDCNISPSIYLNSYYAEYVESTNRECALEEIWGKIKEAYYTYIPRESLDISFLFDYSNVREKIRMKIINTEKNRELLERIVHINYLDLSVVFMITLQMENCEVATITINKEFMEQWGIDETELWKTACENMEEDYDVVSMSSIIAGYIGEDEEVDMNMYVLTNHKKVHGAVIMVQTNILSKVAEDLSAEKLILIPSSIHELILLVANDEMDIADLNKLVKEVNCTKLLEEEVLSDHVYIYDKESDEIKIA